MAEEEKDRVAGQAAAPTGEPAKPEELKDEKKPRSKRAVAAKIFKVTGIVFAVILALLVLLVIFRDFVIRHAVEKVGSFVVGTPVRCGHFSSTFSGKVHIKDLTVGNPEGYHNPYAFQLGEVKVDLDVSTLFAEKIEVREVYVEGVRVDYELKWGRSNLGEIQKNLERFKPADKDNPDSANEGGSEAQQQVVIRRLKVENTALTFSSSTFKTKMPLPLPGLDLENVGDGKPIGETLCDFFDLIFSSINKAVTGAGGVVVDAVGGAVSGIGDAVSGIGDAVKKVTGGGK